VIGNVIKGVFAVANAIDVASRNRIVDRMSRVNGCSVLDGPGLSERADLR
jgi:hypothetical protein